MQVDYYFSMDMEPLKDLVPNITQMMEISPEEISIVFFHNLCAMAKLSMQI
ncbi:hypothetical protein YC2023_103703 [Brassica napus]